MGKSRKNDKLMRVRNFWRDESGQSSFFAALTLFLLVAVIGYSYNVSMVVSKRVRLQNAADAAALSAAAVEANALSAIAWLNGCETYIHARMQEILLDIPYTATAMATAEWGRYIMNRYGSGDLKANPVEMNHNTNQAGMIGGLWNQIKDLVGGLGGIFSGLGDSGGGVDESKKKELNDLLDEYYNKNPSGERKKEIEAKLKDEYGLDIASGVSMEKLGELKKEFEDANNAFNAECDRTREMLDGFERSYSASDLAGCPGAESAYNEMVNIGNNLKSGLDTGEMDDYDANAYSRVAHQLMIGLLQINGAIDNKDSAIGINKLLIKNYESLSNPTTEQQETLQRLKAEKEKLEKEKKQLEDCRDAIMTMHDEAMRLKGQVQTLSDKGQAVKDVAEKMKELSTSNDGIDPKDHKKDADEKRKDLVEQWENEMKNRPEETEYTTERSMLMNSYNDPPEPWALLKMLPIPVFNPYGPNMNMGRMSPLGTPLADVGIGGDYPEEAGVVRDENLAESIANWAKDESLKQGLPPWAELKTAFAGPIGKYLWPDIMRQRYALDYTPDSMADFYKFFHNTLVKQAKKWIGYRNQSGKNFTDQGIRPGEQWIRQLSQISAAIASALPKLVRNEVVYSVAVNASTATTVAIFPDPDDIAKWGDVAFAQTDAEAGQKFFRYDGWFEPPADTNLKRNWMPPPPYVNMYTFANSVTPGIRSAVRFNNKAIWEENGQRYANRFLNESRRQNMRMRTESVAAAGGDKLYSIIKSKVSAIDSSVAKGIFNVQDLLHSIADGLAKAFPALDSPLPSLSYVTLVDEDDNTPSEAKKPLGFFRMNHEKSFYWDEYNGRVGGWKDTDGPGASVRVAVKCWNQNDRMWRQPKTDAVNNNKLLLDMFDGLANLLTVVPVTLPVPYASSHYSFKNGMENLLSKTQVNYNLSPRCQTGYAPGSNVFGLGHAMFIPSHGDPNDAFGAADGHWHYMHYHAHSSSCQVGYPGIGMCSAMANCAFMGLADWFLKGAAALNNDEGPFDRRVGWDSTMHFPYKHWDGTVADDASTMFGGDGPTAQKNHIFCPVSTSNKFADHFSIWNGLGRILGHSQDRQPPFTLPVTTNIKENIFSLVPPLSLYAAVDPCPQFTVPIINFTICLHMLNHLSMNSALHGHVTCDDGMWKHIIPKDMIPLFNTPVLWNWGDSDPSIISMWGAFLTSGDMEGDPFMALGSGDRFFYPEVFYRASGTVGKWLSTDKGLYATGRPRLFTKLNSPLDWAAEVSGAGINAIGEAGKVVGKFGFLDGLSKGMSGLSEGLNKLLSTLGGSKFSGGSAADTDKIKSGAEMFQSGSVFNEIFATIVDLMSRWGHHRFMTCPLCMAYCPLNCDFHDGHAGYPIRHWGGDYGGADTFDVMPGRGADFGGTVGTFYKAIGFMSIMPGLLSTGDQKTDAGMSYANVLRGHDYSPAKTNKSNSHWYKEITDPKKDVPYGNSYFDLGVDLDDGLAGNGPDAGRPTDGVMFGGNGRAWEARFPMDRFVREWMTPARQGGSPDTRLAPTVVITENFMRHGITVAVVEDYKPMLWMFSGRRPMMAVATAKCGFIERPDVYVGDTLTTIDGLGVGRNAAPQIITGIGERDGGAVNVRREGWTLDALWENFLDFPNARPLGESNLYYGNWGAKLAPTRFGILANAVRNTNNHRRNATNQLTDQQEAHRTLWRELGRSTCYRGDGKIHGTKTTLAAQAGMTSLEWGNFAREVVDSARTTGRSLGW